MNYTIYSVHGTFSQSDSKSGNLWWQADSPFSRSILSFLDTNNHRISWRPVQWSGKNSNSDRWAASQKLAESLSHDISANENIALIAHSHGGNIVENSRIIARLRNRSISAITIGTPFFKSDYDSSLINLVDRGWPLAYVVLILSLLSLSFTQEGTFAQSLFSLIAFSSVLIAYMLSLAAAISLVTIKPIASFIRSTPSIFRDIREKADRQTKQQNLAYPKIYSKNDEAINSLKIIRSLKVGLVTSDLATSLSTIIVATILYLLFLHDSDGKKNLWSINYVHLIETALNSEALPNSLTLILNQVPGFGLMLLISIAIAYLISKSYLGDKFAQLLNNILSNLVHQRALGKLSPSSAYQSRKVDANLPLDVSAYDYQHEWGPLPSDFDEDMERINLSSVVKTFMSIRSSLAMSLASGEFALSESFRANYTGNELLHCTYFNHPEFAGFIAWILCEHYGFPRGDTYRELPQQKYERWWESISPISWSAQSTKIVVE